jgi:hypothetical protein
MRSMSSSLFLYLDLIRTLTDRALGRVRKEAHMPSFSFLPWLCEVYFTEQRLREESRVRISSRA